MDKISVIRIMRSGRICRRQLSSVEKQSRSHVIHSVRNEPKATDTNRKEIRHLEQFICSKFLSKKGTLGQKGKKQASFLTQILPLK
jgi:hypothetical protein